MEQELNFVVVVTVLAALCLTLGIGYYKEAKAAERWQSKWRSQRKHIDILLAENDALQARVRRAESASYCGATELERQLEDARREVRVARLISQANWNGVKAV